jgi:DNA-binding response OmpR family regulator
MKILVIDKDNSFCQIIDVLLQAWNHKEIEFSCSLDSLKEIMSKEDNSYDIILLDSRVLKESGEIVEIVHDIYEKLFEKTYIIVMTNSNNKEQMEEILLNNGADDIFDKISEPTSLLKARIDVGLRRIKTIKFLKHLLEEERQLSETYYKMCNYYDADLVEKDFLEVFKMVANFSK